MWQRPLYRQQCQILDLPRSTIYYHPKEEKPENLEMMAVMDKHFLSHLTESVMSMVYLLWSPGFTVAPKKKMKAFSAYELAYPLPKEESD